MKFNQFSYCPVSDQEAWEDLLDLGFPLSANETDKSLFEAFIRHTFCQHQEKDQVLAHLAADPTMDALTFFQSPEDLTEERFYYLALQLLGFIPHLDFPDLATFLKQSQFPIRFGKLIQNLHQLLATRTKEGNSLIDLLVSQGLIPEDNTYHFFNGKSLATFKTSQLIREIVYVDSQIDSDQTGQNDLVKVAIIRPDVTFPLPTMMTASPYQQGVNGPASDASTHPMEGHMQVKKAGQISVESSPLPKAAQAQTSSLPISPATEHFSQLPRATYTLNDYFLARGFANIYVSGIGTRHSDGFMTTGDYQQVAAFRAVIDWLNGRAVAYTSHRRDKQVLANWSTGKVVTTGLSYLGTMSNALATTGVDGLEVVIAEAGISSWYDYYRENGLVVSPGGYPGEDLDTLTEFTASRYLVEGDYLKHHDQYLKQLEQQRQAIDRESGDYNQFWHDRNYRQHAEQVKTHLVFTHGTQDWNVKPIHVYQFFNALPQHLHKHLFLHHGAHVYMNNWQSIDFRESMNALLSQKLLGQSGAFELPTVIWQDNRQQQSWKALDHFGSSHDYSMALTSSQTQVTNAYPQENFDRYAKDYKTFVADLFQEKAQAITIDLPLSEDIRINGRPQLKLRVKSSQNFGLLSAQLLDFGQKDYLQAIPEFLSTHTVDNGRLFKEEGLRELPQQKAPYRLLSKGHMNLQNTEGLTQISELKPNQWLDLTLDLQPTIYHLEAGSQLRVILYTTDFEHTIRDNREWQLSFDWSNASLSLPIDPE